MGVARDDLGTDDTSHAERAEVVRTVSELSGDVVAIVDEDMHLSFGADALHAMLRTAPDLADRENLLSVVHAADADVVRSLLTEARGNSGEVISGAFRLDGAEDQTHFVEARVIERVTKTSQCTVLAIRDVTDRIHTENALRTLRAGNQVLLRSVDELDLLGRMCETMVDVGGYRLAWVGYAQDDAERSVLPMAASGDTDYIKGIRVSWADNEYGRGPTGIAIRTNTIQVAHDIRALDTYTPWRDRALAHGILTSCVLPLSQHGRVIGAVSIYSSDIGAFDGSAVGLLQELAEDLTFGVARLRDASRLTEAFDSTVAALTTISELRDPYTAGHQRRVGMLAAAIGHRLGLDDDSIPWIRIAGELHDLGKIMVPAEILAKPGRLSTAEFSIVKAHPQAAYDIVKSISFPGQVAEMVLQHHERLDGSGYPRGLHGEQILIGSRILAVADTVEAMANHRPYRPSVGLDAAFDEIRASAGRLFDPEVVEACIDLFDLDKFTFDGTGEHTPPSIWVKPLDREIPRIHS